ncbi:MAG: putative Co/Zn/Cd efflux system rane fusion protein [Myxococcales bacterium]|nr:putative Co/Zn/Cd efflux system rane fusion protein [Myxococcales bacterium]
MRSVIVSALFAFVPACKEEAKPPPPPLSVELASVQQTMVSDETEYLAQLRPLTATALQPQVEGHVTQIHVRPGDKVAKGQLLISIDPGPQSAAVTRARSSRAARLAQLRLAEVNLKRARALHTAGATPRQDVDNAETAVTSARNEVAALGADIAGSRAQLRFYRVEAPGPGVVGDIVPRVGDLVTPQMRLTSVTDNSILEANISIPIDRARELTPGTVVRVVDSNAREVATGTVSFISPQADPATQVVLVKATIDNRNGALRGEQVARARLVWRTFEGLTLPALAVVRIGGQEFVFVAQQGKQGWIAKQRPVELGELVNNAYPVQKGLAPGERVVVSQIQKLRDGAPIQPAAG